jgi:hypothetical protein
MDDIQTVNSVADLFTIILHIFCWSSEIMPQRLKSVCDGGKQSEHYKEQMNRLVASAGWEKVPISGIGASVGAQTWV